VLKMSWHCDACHMESVCDASSETHFFGVILLAKRAHESISPWCEWNPLKIHGQLFHSDDEVSGFEARVKGPCGHETYAPFIQRKSHVR
jgi:hypothetical protein